MTKKRLYINSIYAFSMLLIVVMRIVTATGALSGLSQNQTDLTWSVMVQFVIMGLIPFLLYVLYIKKCGEQHPVKHLLNDFGYNRNISTISWIMVALIGVLSTYIVTCVSNAWSNLIEMMGYKPSISTPVYSYSVKQLFFDIFFTACMPAVFEEFTNRGILYEGYKDNTKNPTTVIFVTAIMFALMHTNIRQVGYTFIFGLICGALVFVTKSIWPSMLVHFINNFIAVFRGFILTNYNVTSIYNYLFTTKIGVAIAILLLFIVAFVIFVLILKISQRESERRIAKDRACPIEDIEVGKFDNLPIYFSLSLNTIVTIFTLIWGIIR